MPGLPKRKERFGLNSNGKLAAVILAAGEGKRMKSSIPKVLHELRGKPLLSYVIEAAYSVHADPIVIIASPRTSEIRRLASESKTVVAVQPEPRGTGDAVRWAQPHVESFHGDILILCGDAPLITGSLLVSLVRLHRTTNAEATILTAELEDATGYGRIVRNETGNVIRIVEQADASESETAIREVNTGAYCFTPAALFETLGELKTDNAQGEFYLTDVIESLVRRQAVVQAFSMGTPRAPLGINTPQDLEETARALDLESGERH